MSELKDAIIKTRSGMYVCEANTYLRINEKDEGKVTELLEQNEIAHEVRSCPTAFVFENVAETILREHYEENHGFPKQQAVQKALDYRADIGNGADDRFHHELIDETDLMITDFCIRVSGEMDENK